MLEDVTPTTFRPHVGTPFTVEVQDGEPLVLTLDEVQVKPDGHAQRAEPFTLLFSSPPDRTAAQGTLRLTHEVLGPLDIFMVPVEPGRYEAVFN